MTNQELWRVFVELQPAPVRAQLGALRDALDTGAADAWRFVADECGIDSTTPPEFAARRVREWLANGCACH